MLVEHKSEGTLYYFYLEGDLWMNKASEAINYIESKIADQEVSAVLISLEYVEFIDSSGFGVLAWLRKTLDEKNTKLLFYQPSKKAKIAFESAQWDKVFKVYATKEDALESLK